MVRTRGGSRLRPRVRFTTQEQEEQAAVPDAVPEPVPEEPQGFRRYPTRMGPRAPSQCLIGDPGGAGPPSVPVHQDRGSHRHPDLIHPSPRQQRRRPHRPNYRLPRGSGDRCLLGPRFRGTSDSMPKILVESRTTTCRH